MRTSRMLSQEIKDSTKFLVEFLSPIALAFSIRNYSFGYHAACEITKKNFFEITMEKLAMDIHGYEVGTETCTFSAKLHKREVVGCVYGVPVIVEPHCINPYEFRIKNYHIPKKASALYYPTSREDFLEELDNLLESAKKNMPNASYETKSRTWFIGDYGFSLETGQPV